MRPCTGESRECKTSRVRERHEHEECVPNVMESEALDPQSTSPLFVLLLFYPVLTQKRNFKTYAGSFLSIVGALAVFASDKIMTHWKLHPNPLIYWKMVADFLLAVVAMSSQASNHDDYKNNNDSVYDCNPQVGAWMQFCMLSSETWFFIMALDLFFSLRNPFTSYKNKYPRYHIVAWGLGFISACVLLNEGLTGTSTADICWVKDEEDEVSRRIKGLGVWGFGD